MNFEVGEVIYVIKKEGDWWTGVIGNNTGMFPANYVQIFSDNNATETSVITNDLNQMSVNGSGSNQGMMSAEEAANQADVDSEVSQINTQNVANDANMQEFRGMTSSAVSFISSIMCRNISYTYISAEFASKERRSGTSYRPIRSY